MTSLPRLRELDVGYTPVEGMSRAHLTRCVRLGACALTAQRSATACWRLSLTSRASKYCLWRTSPSVTTGAWHIGRLNQPQGAEARFQRFQ